MGFAAALLLCGCGLDYSPQPRPVEVVLGLENQSTKTSMSADGLHFLWDEGDEISLWAKASDGSYTLENQTFKNFASPDNSRSTAYFGTTLPSPMPEGTYTYYISYPKPLSASGTTVRYEVPKIQNGDVSGGLDITVAEPVTGPELKAAPEAGPVEEPLKVRMKHLLHFLRFYIPEGNDEMEGAVEKIEFTMPQTVAGELDVDVSSAGANPVGEGSTGITMKLRTPLEASSADSKQSAVAAIIPPQTPYGAGESMQVTIYSANKYSKLNFDLAGRTFDPGHITGVPLKPGAVLDRPQFPVNFTLTSNNLGEDIQNITLTLPEGVNWPGTMSNVYKYSKSDGTLLAIGDSFKIHTVEEEEFKAISKQKVAIRFESENAVLHDTLAIADLSTAVSASLSLDCPYLFFEDFSGVEDFSSNDKYEFDSAGSMDPYQFLEGWSAARAGAQAGTAIRLACRRHTKIANYSARADSPFLSALKEGRTVSLSVQFDYSMDRAGTPKVKQTVHLGYTEKSGGFKSGDETGTFPISFDLNETTGSYSNINHTYNAVFDNLIAPIRLSWRTVPESDWGANYNTLWLYLDNIKVKIKK